MYSNRLINTRGARRHGYNKKELILMAELAARMIVVGLYQPANQDRTAIFRARDFTMTYISGERNPYTAFCELCQRVMLIRNWTEENSLDKAGNSQGKMLHKLNLRELIYPGRFWQHLQMSSKKRILFRFDLKMLPQAPMEMAKYPPEEIFNFWYRWFMDRDGEQTWLLIQAICSRYFCGRNQCHQKSYWVRKPGSCEQRKNFSPGFYPSKKEFVVVR